MRGSPDTPLFSPYKCRDCGSEIGFRSRRRTLAERYLLPILCLRPVRCGECFRRDYRLMFTPVRDRNMTAPRIVAMHAPVPTKRNVA
jgi:hypothetical protein